MSLFFMVWLLREKPINLVLVVEFLGFFNETTGNDILLLEVKRTLRSPFWWGELTRLCEKFTGVMGVVVKATASLSHSINWRPFEHFLEC